ncbi:MAG: SpoIIE family protein phosphatase [Muribaculaceae bacterium]|nr:SpoIIE family protein phosphatase [Muribaculaceae bacterium]
MFHWSNTKKRMGVVMFAAVLLLLILAVQHFYTRNLLKNEMEQYAESDIMTKAILVKSVLNSTELGLNNRVWDVRRHLQEPDSIFVSMKWTLIGNPHLRGAGVAFVPDYYSEKGRLFEPYAQRIGDTVITKQISGPHHDYTQMEFYRKVVENNVMFWSDPYVDTIGSPQLISTFSRPIHDDNMDLVAVLGVDVSLDWLSDTLNSHNIYPSSFVMVLTESGKPIVMPPKNHPKRNDAQRLVDVINDSTARRDSSSTKRVEVINFVSDEDDSGGCIFHANLKGKPHWQLAVVCYNNEVYAKLYWMTLNILLLMLASIAVLAYIIRHFVASEEKLHKANIEQERIGSELRIARSIQQAMQPHASMSYIPRDDVDVDGLLLPAKEVGGDLYDYFIRDEKLYFCIGDVSGKGVPSALVMAVAQALFHAASDHESHPGRIMQTINQSLCRNNERNMFVTFFIGVLDLPTGRLRYCNAGHDTPVLMNRDASLLQVKPNLPVGVMPDFKFEQQELELPADTMLFLYTDGLTEAMNPNHEQFGQQRMLSGLTTLCSNNQVTSKNVLDAMKADVHRFAQGADQSDDLTMLVIQYTPKASSDLLDERLVLPNDVKQIPQLGAFVEGVTQRLELDSTTSHQMRLAVEEAVVNVMEYAFRGKENGEVAIDAKSNGECLKFIITDEGVPFDPTEAARADTTLGVEERPIGGLGILLVREMMDSINYERVDGKNILTLRKYYHKK